MNGVRGCVIKDYSEVEERCSGAMRLQVQLHGPERVEEVALKM